MRNSSIRLYRIMNFHHAVQVFEKEELFLYNRTIFEVISHVYIKLSTRRLFTELSTIVALDTQVKGNISGIVDTKINAFKSVKFQIM
ncbi:Uncharacterised protein [Klebsiella pneumoniae]|nr:hypothetical protein EAN95_09995 [Klebsiella quasipneumoniae]SSH43943.1 Uncharacterised protein [Klebsiella pneumoniae]VAN46706.1 Uncharacterised protein [Klebsiella quasivariicola]GKI76418.1 hypothetical protein NUKP6_56000 [Klebsiella variicola]SSH50272.1 Uncharacterised protein [Klebsiella pneumoniae]